jgi:MtN3 and saliva related transmembrane protein
MEDGISSATVIGLLAGTLTTLAYLPQVIKIWRSQSSKDISLLMMSLNCSGIFLWFVYGVLLHSLPIIAANGVTLVLMVLTLILAVKHR